LQAIWLLTEGTGLIKILKLIPMLPLVAFYNSYNWKIKQGNVHNQPLIPWIVKLRKTPQKYATSHDIEATKLKSHSVLILFNISIIWENKNVLRMKENIYWKIEVYVSLL